MVDQKHEIQKYDGFPNCTSLQGYVTTTYDTLIAAFGEPHLFNSDKVNVEWVLLIDGVVVSIYDYKMDSFPMGVYDWHIGGASTEAVELVKSALGGFGLGLLDAPEYKNSATWKYIWGL